MRSRKEGVYRRLGAVRARQLADPVEWVTSAGDRLAGRRGDWLVETSDGHRHTVDPDVFRETYRRRPDGRWDRIGTVSAQRARRATAVDTLEGRAHARPGDWILTGSRGERWPVSDAHFRAAYAPAEITHRGPGPWLSILALLLSGSAFAAGLLALSLRALGASRRALSGAGPAPADHDQTLAWATVALGITCVLVYWWALRGRRSSLLSLAPSLMGLVLFAGLTVALSTATYWPCAAGGHALALPGWVIETFVGVWEFDGPAKPCALTWTPAFDLARSAGLTVTTVGALGVLATLARRHLTRLKVARANDLDVVVGLSDLSVPLVAALCREATLATTSDVADRRPRWWPGVGDGRPAARVAPAPVGPGRWARALWWTTGLRSGDLRARLGRARLVVVVDPDPQNALAATAVQHGAVFVAGSVQDARLIRDVVTSHRLYHRGRRASLRRLYAVTPDQRVNMAVWQLAEAALARPRTSAHLEGVIPRGFVLMDDAREARAWRMSQLRRSAATRAGLLPVIADSLTLDQIMSEEIADHLLGAADQAPATAPIPTVVLAGESDLPLTLLDELAWKLWCRHERGATADQSHPLATIQLCGPHAGTRREEWADLRAPWRASPMCGPDARRAPLFDVVVPPHAEEPERVAAHALEGDGPAMVVFVDDNPAYASAAARLERRFGVARTGGPPRIFVRSADAGTSTDPSFEEGIHRIRRSLTYNDPDGMPTAPQDSMMRLAREQHEATLPPDAPVWSDPTHASRQTRVGWDGLPGFYREDNIRQHWLVLQWFTEHGFVWREVTHTTPESAFEEPTEAELDSLVQAEYERWCTLRRDHGWWAGQRHDAQRLHPELADMGDLAYNRTLMLAILNRLWATGLAPMRVTDGQTGASPPSSALTSLA
ncbi:MAG: PGDYG domain-containing protein [Micrococcales bacterium]|nr:PGDYG domain-containing protein [Micrococcales bacterium]